MTFWHSSKSCCCFGTTLSCSFYHLALVAWVATMHLAHSYESNTCLIFSTLKFVTSFLNLLPLKPFPAHQCNQILSKLPEGRARKPWSRALRSSTTHLLIHEHGAAMQGTTAHGPWHIILSMMSHLKYGTMTLILVPWSSKIKPHTYWGTKRTREISSYP